VLIGVTEVLAEVLERELPEESTPLGEAMGEEA
jgi:hypothetical protein